MHDFGASVESREVVERWESGWAREDELAANCGFQPGNRVVGVGVGSEQKRVGSAVEDGCVSCSVKRA